MAEFSLTMALLALTLFATLALLGGIAVFIATELTAKSKLFRPLRSWLVTVAAHADVRCDPGNTLGRHGLYGGKRRWYDPVTVFIADAFTCPFCTTFWHGFWVATVIGSVGDSVALGLLAYPLSVGSAKLLHDAVALRSHA